MTEQTFVVFITQHFFFPILTLLGGDHFLPYQKSVSGEADNIPATEVEHMTVKL